MGESGDPEVVADASVVSDIIDEVDFVLTKDTSTLPFLSLQYGVNTVALASFSEGGRLLNKVMGGLAGSRLSTTLQGVFVLDSWFGEGKLEEFRGRLRTWFNAGADNKAVRIYQGITVTDPDLFTGSGANVVRGPFGTVQKTMGRMDNPYVDRPSYYYLRMTDEFLRRHAARLIAQTDLHHAVPKLFFLHALKT